MDADQAAIVFVEICTRLDALVDMQRRTNELLGGLESAMKEHLEALTSRDNRLDLEVPRPQRRLGSLIPYGDNSPPSTAATAL